MSGGHFDYNQYWLNNIADTIEAIVDAGQYLDDDGEPIKPSVVYPPDIIERFRETVYNLRRTAAMVQRVDWLLSFDDDVCAFRRRWVQDVLYAPPEHQELLVACQALIEFAAQMWRDVDDVAVEDYLASAPEPEVISTARLALAKARGEERP